MAEWGVGLHWRYKGGTRKGPTRARSDEQADWMRPDASELGPDPGRQRVPQDTLRPRPISAGRRGSSSRQGRHKRRWDAQAGGLL